MKIHNIQDIGLPIEGAKSAVFVTGVTGQDGSHMVDYLLKNTNHFVIGGARRLSVENHENIQHLDNEPRFQLVNFDLTDSHSVYKLMERARPDYFINFAAQTFVASSWDFARQTWETNSTAVLDCLEAIHKVKPTCRFYNAGSSEEFGNVVYAVQDEKHPMRPRSPYGASKVGARQLVKVYRESYGMYAVQGWLFNHEGTRRGLEFVTRKITNGVAHIKHALDLVKDIGIPYNMPTFMIKPIELGFLDAKRDWSDAEDMVDAVWRMLNQDKYNRVLNSFMYDEPQPLHEHEEPTLEEKQKWLIQHLKDYVVASGESHSIREFVEAAFKCVGVKGTWVKEGIDERYMSNIFGTETCLVAVNPKFYRPSEVNVLCGDSSLIRNELGWKPKTSFQGLVEKMVENDLNISKRV